ncbi:hypothetical protein FISHEDRAFT_62984 [Fistulina hepatica ATCC 64428]|uniref:Uncharacterized protein n=1 Tax=Fistulina hepatica ATCC 64428 TaxID=1128425 RepID=A0A0D7A0T9_9AGAR|nr:hypothetical protein FISHEDRAFT_62984 [Fistulina hepatica ATCC 64428]
MKSYHQCIGCGAFGKNFAPQALCDTNRVNSKKLQQDADEARKHAHQLRRSAVHATQANGFLTPNSPCDEARKHAHQLRRSAVHATQANGFLTPNSPSSINEQSQHPFYVPSYDVDENVAVMRFTNPTVRESIFIESDTRPFSFGRYRAVKGPLYAMLQQLWLSFELSVEIVQPLAIVEHEKDSPSWLCFPDTPVISIDDLTALCHTEFVYLLRAFTHFLVLQALERLLIPDAIEQDIQSIFDDFIFASFGSGPDHVNKFVILDFMAHK